MGQKENNLEIVGVTELPDKFPKAGMARSFPPKITGVTGDLSEKYRRLL